MKRKYMNRNISEYANDVMSMLMGIFFSLLFLNAFLLYLMIKWIVLFSCEFFRMSQCNPRETNYNLFIFMNSSVNFFSDKTSELPQLLLKRINVRYKVRS